MYSKIYLFVFVMSTLLFTNVYAQENDSFDRPNYIALKGSYITHSGFFYGRQLDERWLIGGGGYYFFDKDDGETNSRFEYGFEVQYSFFRSSGFNFYALTGVGFNNEKEERTRTFFGNQETINDDSDWYQYGFGLGLMSTSSNGFTINVDGGILRYRRTTNQSSVRTTAGFGIGVAIGYRF